MTLHDVLVSILHAVLYHLKLQKNKQKMKEMLLLIFLPKNLIFTSGELLLLYRRCLITLHQPVPLYLCKCQSCLATDGNSYSFLHTLECMAYLLGKTRWLQRESPQDQSTLLEEKGMTKEVETLYTVHLYFKNVAF